jgi:hypothetical protein
MKRRLLHKTESRMLTIFPKFDKTEFASREEHVEYLRQERRVYTYIFSVLGLIIVASLATIIFIVGKMVENNTVENTAPNTYDEYVEIVANDFNEVEALQKKLDFGEPVTAGYVGEPDEKITIKHYTTNDDYIVKTIKLSKVKKATSEQSYFVENILDTYGTPLEDGKTLWLLFLTTETNIDEWEENMDIPSQFIPYSIPAVEAQEIMITNWKDCSITSEEKTLQGVDIMETTYCFIFKTDGEQKPLGVKYVGQIALENNPYNVYNGEPVILKTPIK